MYSRDPRRRPDVDDMNTAEAVRTAPPPHAMLQLQRTLGNQGVVSMLARNGKKNKKPPPKPIDIDVDDAAGTIKTTAGELIGFKTGERLVRDARRRRAERGHARRARDVRRQARHPQGAQVDGDRRRRRQRDDDPGRRRIRRRARHHAGAGRRRQEPGRALQAARRAEVDDPGQLPDHRRRGTIYLAIQYPRRDRAELGQVQAQPQGVRGPQEADGGRDRDAPRRAEGEDHAGARLHGDDLDARGRRSARAASRSSRRTASTPATARRAGRARRHAGPRPTRRRRPPSTRRPTRTTTPTCRSPATAPPASASTSGRWTRTRPAAAARWSSSSRRCSRARRRPRPRRPRTAPRRRRSTSRPGASARPRA